MSILIEARKDIELESVSYRSSVAESTFQTMGASINFVNRRQYDSHQFNYNGLTRLFVGSEAADGVFICQFDMEVTAVSAFLRRGGSSSSIRFDIRRITGPETTGTSIFSTEPEIDSTGGNNNYFIEDFLNNNTVAQGTGITLPVASVTDLDAGDVLQCVIEQAMPDAEDFMVVVHFRPR